jgi:uncharacterized protein (DUF1684 family)
MNQLEEFRLAKDEFFEKDEQSPLTDNQKLNFHGLNYFPEKRLSATIFSKTLELKTMSILFGV